ncbi:multiple organellar RNA editing factor 2, chloroplastic isoform X1 [Cryptomeria japonica]|uniref:multiple organellar RNA editing factor 2, chloroplastic isoform X1 n=1 Tax=Cryptomeria japonica TaxID=3369 RepID=UPI0025AD959F|nr:multiple organellar RNA editing factor 2, chloroplastic isoform X1 [Cryptomeria japonica]
MAPSFPGRDFDPWFVRMDPLYAGRATKEERIDCYIKTLATVRGSEEAAKKSIWAVSFKRYYGFGCQMDLFTSAKLYGLAGVRRILPNASVHEGTGYRGVPEVRIIVRIGGVHLVITDDVKLLVDGKIVESSPERQQCVTPQHNQVKLVTGTQGAT